MIKGRIFSASEVEHVLCEMAVNGTEDEDQWLYGKDDLRMLQL